MLSVAVQREGRAEAYYPWITITRLVPSVAFYATAATLELATSVMMWISCSELKYIYADMASSPLPSGFVG